MSNATYNAGKDYFSLETVTNNALKVKSSSENRSKQTATGPNTYGDIKCVDSYGETAAPTAEYEVISACTSISFANIGGSLIAASAQSGFEKPVCFGGLTLNTQSGAAPTMTANGQMVQTGATRLRKYSPVGFSLTPRHRAQNCIGTWSGNTFTPAVEIKKGTAIASDVDDYGLQSVQGDLMPIEFTTSMPKGVLETYDLHGGTATMNYTMNWYASTAPTITLSQAAQTAGFDMSTPVGKSDPENGYTQYTWSVSVPMVGSEFSN